MKSLNLVAAASIIVLASCAPTSQGSSESPEIAAGAKAWIDALNAGDVDAVVGMYTQDARVLAPNAVLGLGPEAVRRVFGGMIDAGLGGTTSTLEIRASGDIGYHVGTYVLKTSDGTEVDRGKFIETWKRTDDGWQISNDIFNSDLPVAASYEETDEASVEGEHVDP